MSIAQFPFIVMTGPIGAGKSTQIALLEADLKKHFPAIPVLSTKANENGNAFCEGVRELVDGAVGKEVLAPQAELFAFCAIRAEHVGRVLIPALRRGTLIIQNRHIYDTYADLCTARAAVDPLEFKYFVDYALVGLPVPDLVFYLDVDPEVGYARGVKSGKTKKIEKSVLDYQMRLREGYNDFFSRWSEHRAIRIDSTHKSEEQIFRKIRREVRSFLRDRLSFWPRR